MIEEKHANGHSQKITTVEKANFGIGKKSTKIKRLAIFASYDKNSIIHEYVLYYLGQLKQIADIVFVFDNRLDEQQAKLIEKFCIHSICGKHGEYDFGSYKRGYQWADSAGLLEQYDELIFCNDSVFGPIYPLTPIFEKMADDKSIDFWGVFKTFNDQKNLAKEYAQSYFIVFNKELISSEILKTFIAEITKLPTKDEVVHKYEIGLSQLLIKNGYKCGSFMSAMDNAPHSNSALKLIKNGFPFLKKALFFTDYFTTKVWCSELWKWEKVIRQSNPNFPVNSVMGYLYDEIGSTKLKLRLLMLGVRIPALKHFCFQRKFKKNGQCIIKLFKIPIFISKK